jgi:hypothetical protein
VKWWPRSNGLRARADVGQDFLSTVSDEFRPYRDQLRADLTRHNTEVKVQEDFKDYGGVTLDKLDLYIKACDAVVHLVGDMTGAAAKPESTATILAKYPSLPDNWLRPSRSLDHCFKRCLSVKSGHAQE